MQQWFSSIRWNSLLIAFVALLPLVAAILMKIPQRYSIPFIIVELLVIGSYAMWRHASSHATGDEWWQKDTTE